MKRLICIILTLLLCLAGVSGAFAADNAPVAAEKTGRLYGIGSVSKVFTAAAVMKLVDEGRLDLDTPVAEYIPEFVMSDDRYVQITPRMLLEHSSGLMGMTDNNVILLGDNDPYNHDHFLGFLETQALKHNPGERSIYSNDSFTLAEILVERVSGVTFTEFLEQGFSRPLGLENVKTPQSGFERKILADTYLGNSELKPQNLGAIGSGGIYSTAEELCRFSTIFMDSSDGSVLSKQSVAEMAKVQHKMEIAPDSDTMLRYGLGWDCVEQYPFNRLGIKAVTKGGNTGVYDSCLTVLPEHNMAAVVSSSGTGGMENIIAQQILLAVLEEEGLLPQGTAPELPQANYNRAPVPQAMESNAGIYDGGVMGVYDVSFTGDGLTLTPLGVRNERPMEFIYNTDGDFVSTDGDFLGMNSAVTGARGITTLAFEGNYIVMQTYEDIPGLGVGAEAMPFAEKIEANSVSREAQDAWTTRNDREYLLVSEKYTAAAYISFTVAKTMTDERLPGYVLHGIYKGGGKSFPLTRIVDGQTTKGYQNIPAMMGRDIVNLKVTAENGAKYLHINNYRYIDAAAAIPFSALGDKVVIGNEPVWVDVDDASAGTVITVETPTGGSWFVYDDEMKCIATSLEERYRETIILPENGRLAFAGEPGAVFAVK